MNSHDAVEIWRQAYRLVDANQAAESHDAFAAIWQCYSNRTPMPENTPLLKAALAELVRRKRQIDLFRPRAPMISGNPFTIGKQQRFNGVTPKLAKAILAAIEQQEAV